MVNSKGVIWLVTESRRDGRDGVVALAYLRRATLGLAVVLLALANVRVANAQFIDFAVQPLGRITCVATFVPNLLRSENLAARTGDSRLDCTNDGVFNPFGGNNLTQYVLMNVNLTLNTAVTNMLAGGDALLVVNDNNAWNPQFGSLLPAVGCGFILGGVGSSFTVPDQRYPCPQKAILTGTNTLTWNGIQFPVPGAPNDLRTLPSTLAIDGTPLCDDFFNQVSSESCFDLTSTLRFTNVRGNAAALGAGGTIIATLGVTAFASISVQTNQGAVGIVLKGLITSVSGAVTGLQCEHFKDTFYVHLQEGFAAAFRTLGPPSPTSRDNATDDAGVTQATRFVIRFTEIPLGTKSTVFNGVLSTGVRTSTSVDVCPANEGGGLLCIQRVSGADEDGVGGSVVTSGGTYEVPLDSEGSGFVVYELMGQDPFETQSIVLPVWGLLGIEPSQIAAFPASDMPSLRASIKSTDDNTARRVAAWFGPHAVILPLWPLWAGYFKKTSPRKQATGKSTFRQAVIEGARVAAVRLHSLRKTILARPLARRSKLLAREPGLPPRDDSTVVPRNNPA